MRDIQAFMAKEALTFDSGPLRLPIALGLCLSGEAAWRLEEPKRAIAAYGSAFLLGNYGSVDHLIVRFARRLAASRGRPGGPLDRLVEAITADVRRQYPGNALRERALRLIGSRVVVLKSARANERGVIVADYSYVLPLLMTGFDLDRLTSKFWLVLEPSWNGLVTAEILAFLSVGAPVFIQTNEPKDQRFLRELRSNLRAVPIAANWWTDTSLHPTAGASRDVDIVMIAAWALFKRHWSFLRAIAPLVRKRPDLRIRLVGYAQDQRMARIEELVAASGLSANVSLQEGLTPDQVREQLARSKVLVLWSRREGSNRSVIEALAQDVPIVMREGFNFGHHYSYVNEMTGTFATERTLPGAVERLLERRPPLAPRRWVLENISPSHAAGALEEVLRAEAAGLGEPWSAGLTPKISSLHAQTYMPGVDGRAFEDDYDFIRSCIR